ncbi:MAG: ShlB/FhaC/HecB family hemolysin secretion/activation protein [Paracoccaceae bacterium]|nr:ShlB/FhaC/HecB family hemolysin secretion/activation protein [Paracoccaceae bacterium]
MSPGTSLAQTASEITPDNFQPELRNFDGSVVFTGEEGTQAPPGSENIGITLGGVNLQDALPEMAAANDAFEARLTRGRIPVSELFVAAAELEEAYAQAGFVLARVVLRQQTLRNGSALDVIVVNGFVETVDTTNVPENIKARVDQLTQQLVNRPGLTRRELERQLLLAGDTPGTALRSALARGETLGGTVIALDPEYRVMTGFVGFGNPASDELGEFTLDFGAELNSAFKLGETIYIRLSTAPDSVFGSDPTSRIFAVGAVLPLGSSGASLNVEATQSDTTPDNPLVPTRSDFSRQSVRLIYPFIRERQWNVSGQFALDTAQDSQELISGATIFEDQLTVLRGGADLTYLHENGALSRGNLVVSVGIDAFGARTEGDAMSSTIPLSRAGADAEFTKLAGSFSHSGALNDWLSLAVSARFQSSFGEPLLTSEQFSLVGPQELSTFDSGSLRGDSGWVARTELSTQLETSVGQIPLLVSPYLFAGFGYAKIENPTAIEQRSTEALAYGIGVDLFSRIESNYRSNSIRVEYGIGERDDAFPDNQRLSVLANFRF